MQERLDRYLEEPEAPFVRGRRWDGHVRRWVAEDPAAEAPEFPDPGLQGVNLRGVSRSYPVPAGEPEWDSEAHPGGGWYLDEIPGWHPNNRERLYWLIDFISTEGPGRYPSVWDWEERRLQFRRDWLRRTILECRNEPLSAGFSTLPQSREELAQIDSLFMMYAAYKRGFRLEENLRTLDAEAAAAQATHTGNRRRGCPWDPALGAPVGAPAFNFNTRTTRLLEQELGAVVTRAHTLSALLAQREVRRNRNERTRDLIERHRQGRIRRVSEIFQSHIRERRQEREALEGAWRTQVEQLRRLLEHNPGPENLGDNLAYRAQQPAEDHLGRPELPPGWAWRGDSTAFYYRGRQQPSEGPTPNNPQPGGNQLGRPERPAGWTRQGENETFCDCGLGHSRESHPGATAEDNNGEQRQPERPLTPVGQEAAQPVPAPVPDDLVDWLPQPEEASWDELPQAFMVNYHASPEEQSVNMQAAYYREGEMIWAGDNSPTKMFGEGVWITVLLLFGGIGAELEALLKAGVQVKRVLYVDNDPVSRTTFGHRLRALHHAYPEQLPQAAYHATDTALPWDIREIGQLELQRHTGADCRDPIHLVTVSSPCQGFSRANRQARGLEDTRSCLILEAWRILALLQRMHRPFGMEPGYIFEMVDAGDHASPPARWGFQQMELISGGYAGSGIRLDAARLGAAAHRIRVFWTNLARATDIQERYTQFDREQIFDKLDAQHALDPFRAVQLAQQDDPAVAGYFRINTRGEPMRAFPTLVATPSSYAFRFQGPDQPGPGMVYDRNLREWQEPNADERERIMGMLPGSTRGFNVCEEERRRMIGSAVDVRAYTWLCKEIRRWRVITKDE